MCVYQTETSFGIRQVPSQMKQFVFCIFLLSEINEIQH